MGKFSDPSDYATHMEEREREHAIKTVLNKKESNLKPKGRCHNCDELLNSESSLFCDTDCRDDYDWRMEREKHNKL